jgi:hypothetical protein
MISLKTFFGSKTVPAQPHVVHVPAPYNILDSQAKSHEVRRFAIVETLPGSQRWNINIEAFEKLGVFSEPDARTQAVMKDIYSWKFDGIFARELDWTGVMRRLNPYLNAQSRKTLADACTPA